MSSLCVHQTVCLTSLPSIRPTCHLPLLSFCNTIVTVLRGFRAGLPGEGPHFLPFCIWIRQTITKVFILGCWLSWEAVALVCRMSGEWHSWSWSLCCVRQFFQHIAGISSLTENYNVLDFTTCTVVNFLYEIKPHFRQFFSPPTWQSFQQHRHRVWRHCFVNTQIMPASILKELIRSEAYDSMDFIWNVEVILNRTQFLISISSNRLNPELNWRW